MLHCFAPYELVLNTHEPVLCIFNHIFMGCELVCIPVLNSLKECIINIRHVSGSVDHDFNYLYHF